VCSGLPTDRFSFYGFLPKKEKKKIDFFNGIKGRDETIVVYESPHRIRKTIEIMKQAIPDKDVVIARELTKKFEEFVRGKVRDVKADDYKGEIVVIIH
ncbi:rRNA (cytidine-2'-O-)-methyltransferase, partial [Candidatus Woesearchaeota archaeon]|nr:rRNA (cytidine-2'-O-)-methyltransferase [Candidatus Woesearchaeota archaeon]